MKVAMTMAVKTIARVAVLVALSAVASATAGDKNAAVAKTEVDTLSGASSQKSVGADDDRGGIEMVFVKGGAFKMGCTSEQDGCSGDEIPVHKVTLSDFYIGKYEVTQNQWVQVMGGDNNPSYFKGGNLPVEQVSWNDAQKFILRLNSMTGKKYRLPTEAEWEYAARGGTDGKGYRYSGSDTLGNVAWYKDNCGNQTHVVGTKSPNELGIYDMSGNVLEWVSDWYGNYGSAAAHDPKGPSSSSLRVFRSGGKYLGHSGYQRVRRGCSWTSVPLACRVSFRGEDDPNDVNDNKGFRLVLSPSETAVLELCQSGDAEPSEMPAPVAGSGTFTDERDGKTYRTVKIGKQTWMAENLSYKTNSGSWCYWDITSCCDKYGRLYDWSTAKIACPAGWHLSTAEEWDRLLTTVGGKKTGDHDWVRASKKLRTKSGWNKVDGYKESGNGTDDYGFSAIPVGQRYESGNYQKPGFEGIWWVDKENNWNSAYSRRIRNYDKVLDGTSFKGQGYSVRCVSDDG